MMAFRGAPQRIGYFALQCAILPVETDAVHIAFSLAGRGRLAPEDRLPSELYANHVPNKRLISSRCISR